MCIGRERFSLHDFKPSCEDGWFGGDWGWRVQVSCVDETSQTQKTSKHVRKRPACIRLTILHLWKLERCGGFRFLQFGVGHAEIQIR